MWLLYSPYNGADKDENTVEIIILYGQVVREKYTNYDVI